MKTFTLKIYNKDNSIYWTEHFNSKKELDIWLEEEKTRPYWKEEFVCNIEEIDNPVVDMSEEIAKIEAKRNSAKLKLKALGLTDDEISALLGI